MHLTYLATEEQAIAAFTGVRDALDHLLRYVHVERTRPKVVEKEERLLHTQATRLIDAR